MKRILSFQENTFFLQAEFKGATWFLAEDVKVNDGLKSH